EITEATRKPLWRIRYSFRQGVPADYAARPYPSAHSWRPSMRNCRATRADFDRVRFFVGWAKAPAAADGIVHRPRATFPTRSDGPGRTAWAKAHGGSCPDNPSARRLGPPYDAVGAAFLFFF